MFWNNGGHEMVTNHQIERRCRYLLSKHCLRVHKVQGNRGPVYYAYEVGDDDPPEWMRHYMDIDGLLDFAEEIAEKEFACRTSRR